MRIQFSLTLITNEALEPIVKRLGARLHIDFEPSEPAPHVFDEMEIFAGYALGLELVVIAKSGGRLPRRVVRFSGHPDEATAAVTAGESGSTNVSDFMLAALGPLADEGWYVTTVAEVLAEAGIVADSRGEDGEGS